MSALFLQNRRREMKTVDLVIEEKHQGIVIEDASTGDGNKCLFRYPCTIIYHNVIMLKWMRSLIMGRLRNATVYLTP